MSRPAHQPGRRWRGPTRSPPAASTPTSCSTCWSGSPPPTWSARRPSGPWRWRPRLQDPDRRHGRDPHAAFPDTELAAGRPRRGHPRRPQPLPRRRRGRRGPLRRVDHRQHVPCSASPTSSALLPISAGGHRAGHRAQRRRGRGQQAGVPLGPDAGHRPRPGCGPPSVRPDGPAARADRRRPRPLIGRRLDDGELGRLLRIRVPTSSPTRTEAYARRYVDDRPQVAEAERRVGQADRLRRGRRPQPVQAHGLQGRVRGGPAAPRGGRPAAGGERRSAATSRSATTSTRRCCGPWAWTSKLRLGAVVHAGAARPRSTASGCGARRSTRSATPRSAGSSAAGPGVPEPRRAAGAEGSRADNAEAGASSWPRCPTWCGATSRSSSPTSSATAPRWAGCAASWTSEVASPPALRHQCWCRGHHVSSLLVPRAPRVISAGAEGTTCHQCWCRGHHASSVLVPRAPPCRPSAHDAADQRGAVAWAPASRHPMSDQVAGVGTTPAQQRARDRCAGPAAAGAPRRRPTKRSSASAAVRHARAPRRPSGCPPPRGGSGP